MKKGLLEDDRTAYALGGLSSIIGKAVSKKLAKSKSKSSKAKPTQKELEDELRQLEYEQQQLMEDNINTPEGLVGARLDASEEISDLADDVIKNLKKNYPDSKLLKRISFAEGGSLLSDDMPMDMPMEEQETPEVVTGMGYQEGGSLLDDDMSMMPEDMKMSPEPMDSDEVMEDNYVDFVISQALSEEQQEFLNEQLEGNDMLSVIFDQVIEAASEFTGDGSVEGPGTGVSDDIPARLSDGEFVFTAKAVEEIGEDTLMSMMKEAEAGADERQQLAVGGMPDMEEEIKKDQFGNSIESNITDDEIRKGMLSTNPRLK